MLIEWINNLDISKIYLFCIPIPKYGKKHGIFVIGDIEVIVGIVGIWICWGICFESTHNTGTIYIIEGVLAFLLSTFKGHNDK
jgi:hypothetical protein